MVLEMFLTGRLATLRPVGPDDYEPLFQWSLIMPPHHALALRTPPTWFPDLVNAVESMIGTSMVLVLGDDHFNRVGCAVLFEMNPLDRHTHLDLFAISDCPTMVVMEGWLLLIDHVFAWFPVSRIYRRLPTYANLDGPIAGSQGFEEEGCLKEHIWYEGKYWDTRILSLKRERWTSQREIYIDNLMIQAQYEASHRGDPDAQ